MGEVGIADSDEDAWAYLEAVTEGKVAAAQRRAFLDGANRMISTFESETGVRFEPMREYPDYDTDQPGAKPGGRALEPLPFDGNLLGEDFATLHPCYPGELIFDRFMMRLAEARALLQPGVKPKLGLLRGLWHYALRSRSRRRWHGRDPYLTLGQALTARLRAELTARGVPLHLGTAVRRLLTDDGRVVGVELGTGERILARAGVLLATGGFERNDAMRQRYQHHPVDAGWTVGHVGNTGDGLTLAEQAGACLDTEMMHNCWWSPAVVPPGEPTAWVLVIEKSLPYGIFVDRDGRRFVNEASNYNNVGKTMYEAQAKNGKAVPAWMIFDAKYRKKFPIGPVKPGMLQPDRRVPERLPPATGGCTRPTRSRRWRPRSAFPPRTSPRASSDSMDSPARVTIWTSGVGPRSTTCTTQTGASPRTRRSGRSRRRRSTPFRWCRVTWAPRPACAPTPRAAFWAATGRPSRASTRRATSPPA
ncbi:MAG: 3-oxosteroid 1-dehydrogenase [Mycobacterium sp.]|jgi:3-oxosteroid 1-dehydrogenase|nr:3-oxosteroid 1-dehydrogenase [Mycobacterium sp.]